MCACDAAVIARRVPFQASPQREEQHVSVTGFHDDRGLLACDGVPLTRLAESEGTPLYVYSAAVIRERYAAFERAFAAYPHAIHYALKANSTLALVTLLRHLGADADVTSDGELDVALRTGYAPHEIVFTGVGKTADELARAVALGVKVVNAESPGELARIDALASAQGVRANVALRINPDINARSHPHISTGRRASKFGVPLAEAGSVCREAAARKSLRFIGIHVHIGSQIVTLEPIRRAAEAVATLARELQGAGIALEHLDLGGGLGISYDDAPVPGPDEYASVLIAAVQPTGLTLVLEPGRTIVGPAGAIVARVVDVKAPAGSNPIVVLDAGMTECLRPALYGARHRVRAVAASTAEPVACEVVGPLCETSDSFGIDHALPPLEVGALVAVLDTGAYAASMASNYNRRPRPAEVLVDEGRGRVITCRQTIDAMLAGEA